MTDFQKPITLEIPADVACNISNIIPYIQSIIDDDCGNQPSGCMTCASHIASLDILKDEITTKLIKKYNAFELLELKLRLY